MSQLRGQWKDGWRKSAQLFQLAIQLHMQESMGGLDEVQTAYKRLQEMLMEQQVGTERALTRAIKTIDSHELNTVWVACRHPCSLNFRRCGVSLHYSAVPMLYSQY